MAGEAEKKRQKRNSEILLVLRAGSAIAFVVFFLLRFFVFAGPGRVVKVLFWGLAVAETLLVWTLGRWSDSVDLADPGLVEYMRDAVYLAWIVLAMALATDWAFLLLLAAPVFAAYKIYGALPAAPASSGDEEDEKKRPKKVSKLTKAEKIAASGAEYRGGKPKFSRH